MEEKKTKYNKIPNVIGKYEDDARDYLNKKKIKVQKKSVKKFNLNYKSGTVIEIEPSVGTKLAENKKATLYVASNRMFTLVLSIIVLLLAFLGYNTYKHSYVIFSVKGPVITKEFDGFVKNNVVRIKKDSELKGLTDYQYCKTTLANTNNCVWMSFLGDEVNISESGRWYVYMRAFNKENKKYSLPSSPVEVQIDRDPPTIKNVTFVKENNKYNFEIDAIDLLSGIKLYMYSLDGINYIETYSKFKLNNLNIDTIYVKVIDNLDNETIKIVNI